MKEVYSNEGNVTLQMGVARAVAADCALLSARRSAA
jgi:hypothetical protein